MTSKEALEIVSGGKVGYTTYETFYKAKNLLLKELEVLALIREHLHSINSIKTRETIGLALFSKRYQEINKCGGDDMFVSKEDFEKIKQWVYSTSRYDKETMEID